MTGTPASRRASSASRAAFAPPVSCTSGSMPSRSSVLPVHPGIARVLPLIPESQGEDRPAVDLAAVFRLELPEDVAGTQAAADAEDRGLGQRLAGHARDDALVRQDVGQRGRLRVQAAAHPIARRGGGVGRRLRVVSVRGALEQGASGGGVSLAGLGHARTHDPLEGLVGGHRSGLRHGRRRTRPHRHVVGRSDGRPVRPEDPDPLYRRIAAPRGGSVWQSGTGACRRQSTTPRNRRTVGRSLAPDAARPGGRSPGLDRDRGTPRRIRPDGAR